MFYRPSENNPWVWSVGRPCGSLRWGCDRRWGCSTSWSRRTRRRRSGAPTEGTQRMPAVKSSGEIKWISGFSWQFNANRVGKWNGFSWQFNAADLPLQLRMHGGTRKETWEQGMGKWRFWFLGDILGFLENFWGFLEKFCRNWFIVRGLRTFYLTIWHQQKMRFWGHFGLQTASVQTKCHPVDNWQDCTYACTLRHLTGWRSWGQKCIKGPRATSGKVVPSIASTSLPSSSGLPNVISVLFRPNISAEYSAETISVFYICFSVSAETLFSAEIASFGRNSQFWPK